MQIALPWAKKKSVKERLGVCIPRHVKKKFLKERKNVLLPEGLAEIEIESFYNLGNTCMVQGKVLNGEICVGMKLKDKEVKISEIRHTNFIVEKLLKGDKGAVFLDSKIYLPGSTKKLLFEKTD